MSRTFEIIGNLAMFGFLLGFAVWLFWRAFRRSTDPSQLIFKWILTVLALIVQFTVSVPAFRRGGDCEGNCLGETRKIYEA